MNTKKQHNLKKTTQGSFLLELLIAFAVISISLTVVVDSFFSSQKSYRIIADQAGLARTITTVLEDITREARVSELYKCALVSTSPCNNTVFSMTRIEGLNGQAADSVVYTLDASGAVTKSVNGASAIKMTPPSIQISNFTINVFGEQGVDQVQAFVTLTANTVENSSQKVHLQTSFTERLY